MQSFVDSKAVQSALIVDHSKIRTGKQPKICQPFS